MHKQLTMNDRLKIEKALRNGLRPMEIAALLRVHNSTIYRELRRGYYDRLGRDLRIVPGYSPEIAQARRDDLQSSKGVNLKIGKDHQLADFIETKIADQGYSPAAVIAEIKQQGLKFATKICDKTIYNYIEKGVFRRLSLDNLPQKGKRKKHKPFRHINRRPPAGASIEIRPPEVDHRATFGHWEMDTVIGKRSSKPTLLVLSERLTRQEIIVKMPDKTAGSVVAALDGIEEKYGRQFSKIFKTITVDNGVEFSACAGMEKSLYAGCRTKIYYCHPYSAYERGTNENANRLIRRFLPKGTDFKDISEEYIQKIQEWINNYPRKILNWRNAATVFREQLAAAGLTPRSSFG